MKQMIIITAALCMALVSRLSAAPANQSQPTPVDMKVSSMTIANTPKVDTLVFYDDQGKEIGKIHFDRKTGVAFTGDVRRSARAFFKYFWQYYGKN